MSPSPSLSILAANVPDRMEAVETEVQDIYVNISWNLPDFGSSSVTAYDLQFRVDDTTTFASILPECDGSDETIVSQRFCLAPKSKLRLIHFLDISTRASQHGLMLLLTQPERRTISKWLLSINGEGDKSSALTVQACTAPSGSNHNSSQVVLLTICKSQLVQSGICLHRLR